MKRKGISPIIASVLLLAVSLAVVGIFSGWAPQLAQDVTDRTENSTLETLNCNEASMEIRSAFWSGSDVTVALRNSGSQDLSQVSIVAYDSDQTILAQTTGVSVGAGNITEQTISSVSSEPAEVEAFSGTCGSVTASISDINQ